MQGNMNEPAIDCWQRNLAVCLFGAFTTVFAMTLILPFLPVYIGQLGVSGHAAIVQWSGIAYAATFVTAGLVAPLWGMLGDRYGRKPMLVRASLGMAITMLLMGLASDIWQFIGLRLLAGIAGGYSSGSTRGIGPRCNRAVVRYRLRRHFRHRRVGSTALGDAWRPLRSQAHAGPS